MKQYDMRKEGFYMLAVQGYYDGATIQPLETLVAKPNQRVIITVMDEFVEVPPKADEERLREIERLCGSLSKYANPVLMEKEGEAWGRAAVEKYGNL